MGKSKKQIEKNKLNINKAEKQIKIANITSTIFLIFTVLFCVFCYKLAIYAKSQEKIVNTYNVTGIANSSFENDDGEYISGVIVRYKNMDKKFINRDLYEKYKDKKDTEVQLQITEYEEFNGYILKEITEILE